MKTLTIKLKEKLDYPIEAEALKPESFAGKTMKQILELEVYAGNRKKTLGEVFQIEGEIAKKPEDQKLLLEGDFSKVKRIGEDMKAGEILVKGGAGLHLGEGMVGGSIIVEEDAGGWVGTGMRGGTIEVKGSVECYVGCAVRGEDSGMSGGTIKVGGNVGLDVGKGLIGGEITVEGRVEKFTGSYMSGGTIKARECGSPLGYAMKKGSITVETPMDAPFYLKRKGEDGQYILYDGDVSFKGKGEVRIRR
ncbi:MAG: formylmethanofuran dehydrogenase subunit C [Candidatus Altiarchaeota archaeon]